MYFPGSPPFSTQLTPGLNLNVKDVSCNGSCGRVLNVEFLSYNAIVMHAKIQIHELDLIMNTSIWENVIHVLIRNQEERFFRK